MSVAVTVESSGVDQLVVRGELSFATAAEAHAAGCALLQRGSLTEMRVDCAGIVAADSAGLAVLLDWLAVASRRGPTQPGGAVARPLQQLARIGGVSELLGLKAESG